MSEPKINATESTLKLSDVFIQENDTSSNQSGRQELFVVEAKRKRQDSVEEIVEGDPFAGVGDGNNLLQEPKVELEIKEELAEMLQVEISIGDPNNEEAERPINACQEDVQTDDEPIDANPSTYYDVLNTSAEDPSSTYMCTICKSVFLKKCRLRIHVRRKHNLLSQTFPYNCNICGESYDQKSSLKAHLKRRHGPESQNKDDEKIEVTCDICGNVLVGKRRLRFHKQRMHKIEEGLETSFQCHYCSRTYDRASSLKMHQKRKHYSYGQQDQGIECPLCPKRFTSRQSYMGHLKRKHHHKDKTLKDVANIDCSVGFASGKSIAPSENFLCNICNSMFLNHSRLRLHMRRKHDLFKHAFNFKCNICGDSYEHKNSLRAHMKRTHGPDAVVKEDRTEVTCDVCGCVFVGKRRLRFHMHRIHQIDNEPAKFKCLRCPCTYDKASSLHMHTKRKHMPNETIPEDISCTQCSKRFTSRPSYMSHLKRVHLDESKSKTKFVSVVSGEGKSELACSQCSLSFSDVRRLRHHMKNMHEQNSLQYKCSFCPLTYDKRASLIQHLTRKHNKDLFCETCKKQFTSQEMFKNHSHANSSAGQQTPVYQCGICKMIYVREGSLAKHMRLSHGIITSDMTLFCDVCGKGFWKQSYLNSHMKIHLGVNYTCAFCKKTCNAKETLRQHILRHHQTESMETATDFPCQQCGESFATEKDMCSHIVSAHPNVIVGDLKIKVDPVIPDHEHEDEGHKSVKSTEEDATQIDHLQCPECGEYFNNESELVQHNNMTHDKADEVVCQHCGLVMNAFMLNKHMVAEHRDLIEIFQCEHCNYQSWKKNLLWKHKQCHSLEKKFSCSSEGCSYKAASRSRLQQHFMTHKAKVRLRCSQCTYETNNPYIMKNHKNEHVTGRKRYACDHCDYATNYPANINIHRFKHSKERSFECNECKFTTKYPTSMYFHKKKHHTNIAPADFEEQAAVDLTAGDVERVELMRI